jgi:hypothetical protein
MTVELTNEEKTVIVLQHIKTVAYAEYNAILALSEEQAILSPNQNNITTLTNQLADILAQKQVLQNELDSLS